MLRYIENQSRSNAYYALHQACSRRNNALGAAVYTGNGKTLWKTVTSKQLDDIRSAARISGYWLAAVRFTGDEWNAVVLPTDFPKWPPREADLRAHEILRLVTSQNFDHLVVTLLVLDL